MLLLACKNEPDPLVCEIELLHDKISYFYTTHRDLDGYIGKSLAKKEKQNLYSIRENFFEIYHSSEYQDRRYPFFSKNEKTVDNNIKKTIKLLDSAISMFKPRKILHADLALPMQEAHLALIRILKSI